MLAKFTALLLLLGLAATPLEAGFRSPESLVRNVYAHYGKGTPGFSGGLPHDPEVARQFFDPPLQSNWVSSKPPFDFLVQSTRWMLGPVSIAVIRKQFDKTYVAVAFSNNQRAVSLNFVIINGPDGWVISDVESPRDSLRSFLAQHRN